MGQWSQMRKKVNEILRLSKDLQSGKFANDIASACVRQITNDLGIIFSTSIDKYYKTPHRYYKRTHSLYTAYRIENAGTHITAVANSSKISKGHRVDEVDPDYIFNHMFGEGYHGGATSGPPDKFGHPFPGPMALRTPVPYFSGESMPPYSSWSRMKARKSEAPKDMINADLQAYQSDGANASGSTLKKRFQSAFKKVMRSYSIFK